MEVPSKILFALSKITNECLGEEGTMGCHPFCFIFKNVLFFIYYTEQNTKEIIWLRTCYLLTKTRRNTFQWYGSTMGYSRKKNKQGRGWLKIWNFQRYWRNSKWNFKELMTNNVEFSEVFKKNLWGISSGFWF